MQKKFDNYSLQSKMLEKSLTKDKHEVSVSAFAFLFSEMVQHGLMETKKGYSMEDRLHEMGIRTGYRVLDLLCYREKNNKRETRIVSMLTFVAQTCWKYLFGHTGELLKGQDRENEYMINDKALPLNRFISVPRDFGSITCAAYAAGIVEGILCSAEFPAEVSAHTVDDGFSGESSTILIKFMPEVIKREKELT